mmetsp:Transcript_35795/g.92447  ORF Transcript_35795/g.92447 Transcript_35795/m.92447 type:complete len:289 (+) Transcript_35795:261-1127(+)
MKNLNSLLPRPCRMSTMSSMQTAFGPPLPPRSSMEELFESATMCTERWTNSPLSATRTRRATAGPRAAWGSRRCKTSFLCSCRLGTATGRWKVSSWGASATRASRHLVNRSYPTALSSSKSRCRRCRFPRVRRPQPHYRSRRSAGMGTPGPWRGGPTMQHMPEKCPPICYASTPRRGPRPTPPSAAAWRRRWLPCPPSRRRGRGRARASPPRARSNQARHSCPARCPRPRHHRTCRPPWPTAEELAWQRCRASRSSPLAIPASPPHPPTPCGQRRRRRGSRRRPRGGR